MRRRVRRSGSESAEVALARARIAADHKSSNLRALLETVPRELHGDPGYVFARIQLLRREEKFAEAARLMLNAPRDPNRLYNVDEWWIERRLLARKMIDVGDYRTAYLIARDAALPARDIYKTEQEFTAGWIALRFLKDPNTAARHFARIGVGSVNPTALARSGYWQGRAAEAAGRVQDARHAYAAAAEQSTSYYGQLARAKLGLPQIELRGVPGSRSRGVNGWRSCAPSSFFMRSAKANSRSRSLPTWAKTATPMRCWDWVNSPRVTATPKVCC